MCCECCQGLLTGRNRLESLISSHKGDAHERVLSSIRQFTVRHKTNNLKNMKQRLVECAEADKVMWAGIV